MMNTKQIILASLLIIILAIAGYLTFQKRTDSQNPLSILCSSESANSPFVVSTNPFEKSYFLGGNDCKTLYISAQDGKNESLCDGECLQNWAPYLAVGDVSEIDEEIDFIKIEGLEGKFSTFSRKDGGLQYTYEGQPLYYFKGDIMIGTTRGNRLEDGNWRIVPIAVSDSQ